MNVCLSWFLHFVDGTVLNTGENMLYLIRSLGNEQYLKKQHFYFHDSNPAQDENAVFFDLFYFVLISYTGIYVPLIHGSIFLFAFYTLYCYGQLYKKAQESIVTYVKKLLWIEGKNVLAGLGGALVVSILATLFFPMRWYEGHIPMMVAMYTPPTLLASLYQRGKQNQELQLHPIERQLATLSLWCLLGFPLFALNLMSAYVYCLWILSTSVCVWVYDLASRYGYLPSLWKVTNAKDKSKGITSGTDGNVGSATDCLDSTAAVMMCEKSPIQSSSPVSSYLFSAEGLYLLACVPITMILHRIIDQTYIMFIPLMGKSGTVVPSDILIGLSYAYIISLPIGNLFANEINTSLSKKFVRKSVFSLVLLYLFLMFSTKSYTDEHPKRLWIQHVERTYPKDYVQTESPVLLSETKTDIQMDGKSYIKDHGLWVLGFDSQGLVPIAKYILDAIDPSFHVANLNVESVKQASTCDANSGHCFATFPYYFPVPDVLRDMLYLPTSSRPTVEDREDLKLNIEKHEGGSDGKVLISVTVSGPSHIHLIFKERKHLGKVLTRWFLDEETLKGYSITSQDIIPHLQPVDPLRWEGMRYMEVGFGQCSAKKELCSKRIWLEIDRSYAQDNDDREDKLLEVIAYAHYVDQIASKEVVHLMEHLPNWSKGSEWTRFPSKLQLEWI